MHLDIVVKNGLRPEHPLGDLPARQVLGERLRALPDPRGERVLDEDRHPARVGGRVGREGTARAERDHVAAEGGLALEVLRPRRVGVHEPALTLILGVTYRVTLTHLVSNLGWADFDLGCYTILLGQ